MRRVVGGILGIIIFAGPGFCSTVLLPQSIFNSGDSNIYASVAGGNTVEGKGGVVGPQKRAGVSFDCIKGKMGEEVFPCLLVVAGGAAFGCLFDLPYYALGGYTVAKSNAVKYASIAGVIYLVFGIYESYSACN